MSDVILTLKKVRHRASLERVRAKLVVELIIVFAIGIPLGLVAARLAGTWLDPMIIGTLLFLQAIPEGRQAELDEFVE